MQDGLPPPGLDLDAIREKLVRLRSGHDEVSFVGGEPTLVRELPDLVAHARELGFVAIGLQTHGGALADPTRRRALFDAGLTDVHLSIHGATAAAHDYHTDRPGSFERAIAAAEGLRQARVPFVVSTVVTRSSYRGLDALAVRLARMGAAAWALWWPVIAGRAADAFDRTIPRLGLATPSVLHAVATAMRRDLAVALAGFPACALGPFAALALPVQPLQFPPVCTTCDCRAACVGIAPAYLQRHGESELHPRAAVSSTEVGAAKKLRPAHARMFVGPGPSAARSPVSRAPSPAAARASLPILGRPEPARAEVRGRSRQTGAALRELFPELFADAGGDADESS